MDVRPFSLVAQSVLDAVRTLLEATVQRWEGDWGECGLRVECTRTAQDAAGAAWRSYWREGERALWIGYSDAFIDELQRALFPSEGSHAAAGATPVLAPIGARRALEALCAALGTAVAPNAALVAGVPAQGVTAPASGAVLARVALGRQTLMLLLAPETVEWLASSVVRPAPAVALEPVDLRGAAADVWVALPVQLGAVQIDLAALMSVATGDVLRLNTRADAAFPVQGPGGEVLFHAYLGKAGDRLAIEVAPRNVNLLEVEP